MRQPPQAVAYRKSLRDEIIREGLFDDAWYRAAYPDVGGRKDIDGFDHYVSYGASEGRDPSASFNTFSYLAANPDVKGARLNPLLHYAEFGIDEGRLIEPSARIVTDVRSGPPPTIGAQHTRIDYDIQFKTLREHPRGLDYDWYRSRYMDIATLSFDEAVEHYVKIGARSGRWPRVDFDSTSYARRHRLDSSINPLFHFLSFGNPDNPKETVAPYDGAQQVAFFAQAGIDTFAGAKAIFDYRRSLAHRIANGEIGEMVAKAGQFDPLVHHNVRELGLPGVDDDVMLRKMHAIRNLQEEALGRRATAVVVIPHCRGLSGAAKVAGELARALSDIHGQKNVLVLRTDGSEMDRPDWFGAGIRQVDFFDATKELAVGSRKSVFVNFIRSLCPSSVYNVNSRLMWHSMDEYGTALSECFGILAYLFCSDYDKFGHEKGYPVEFFYRCFDNVHTWLVDSKFLAAQLTKRFQLTPGQQKRVVVISTPMENVETRLPVKQAGKSRQKVFWAGRFDRQKRVDVVYEIAKKMSNVDFHMWGKPVADLGEVLPPKPGNVWHDGTYKKFSDLQLADCDAWLYTSQWDGIPTLLLTVIAHELPLVTSVAGGCSELLPRDMCKAVEDIEDIDGFVDAIRQVLADRGAALARSALLKKYNLVERNRAGYVENIRIHAGKRQ